MGGGPLAEILWPPLLRALLIACGGTPGPLTLLDSTHLLYKWRGRENYLLVSAALCSVR